MTAQDTSEIQALAGGIGIAIATSKPIAIAAGVSVAVNKIYDTAEASIAGSTVAAAGDVDVTATSTPTIKALTIGVAVSVATGGGGFAGSGAGAGSGNTVGDTVAADISSSTVGTSGSPVGGAVNISATDTPTIEAAAGALGVGVVAGTGGALGIGISAAINDVADSDNAFINDAEVTAQSVSLTALETANIEALSIGGAVGANGGGGGVGVGAAGAGSGNTIADTVQAYISTSSAVTTENSGAVDVTATESSTITANAGGVGIGAAIGGAGGVGVSLGVAAATDDIENQVEAYVDNSTVTAAGAVKLSANETATIKTLTIGGSVGVGTGGFVGAGVAVAGSDSVNNIQNVVSARITGGSTVHANGGGLTIGATDNSSITATSGGFAVGLAAAGLEGGAAAVGFAVASNTIENTVTAYTDNATVNAAGDLSVSASETATIVALSIGGAVAVGFGGYLGAAAAGAGGNSTNTLRNKVKAYLADRSKATTTASGNVNLTAIDSASTTATTVAASVSVAIGTIAASVSVGAAIAVNDIADTVLAYADSSNITSAGNITVGASATSTVEAKSSAASLSIAAGLSGAFAGGGANSTNTVDNTVQAYIAGAASNNKSTITATGNIALSATETCNINSFIGAFAAASGLIGASIGVSVADNTVTSTITAYVDNASVTANGSGNITIGAGANDTVTTFGLATSIAAALGAAGAGATATVNVSPAVEAYAGSGATLSATGGNVSVTATATDYAHATTFGLAGGFVAVGVSITAATADGSVKAHVDGPITGSQNVTVRATATDTADAVAIGLAGGVNAGAGAGATAAVAPTISAYTLGNIAASKSIMIAATLTPTTMAQAVGVAVGYEAGVGASTANADNGATINAYVGDNSVLTGNAALTVMAQQAPSGTAPSANAFSAAGGGGLLVGADAAVAAASSSGTVDADTGNSVTLPAGGASISALNTTSQSANATGVSVGYIAAGAVVTSASSNVTTSANLGNDNSINSTTANVSVEAIGSDQNLASSIAGSGGVFSGLGGSAATSTTATTTAGIGTGSTLTVNSLTLEAEHTATFNSTVNALNIALAGGSAASCTNAVNSTVTANIGAGTDITAYSVDVSATNNEVKRLFAAGQTLTSDPTGADDGSNINSIAAGVGSLAGASSTTTIVNTTTVNVGDGATVDVIGSYFNPGDCSFEALNDIQAVDKTVINNGGFVAVSTAVSSITADTDNATVNIGSNTSGAATTTLESVGDIDVAALSEAYIGANANVKVYGFAGGAAGTSTSDVANNDTVHLYPNAYLHSEGSINLMAGQTAGGAQNRVIAQANTNLYIDTAFGGSTPNANANIHQTNYVQIDAGAQVLSVANANINAVQGYHRADGEGHGEVVVAGVPNELDGGESTDNPTDGVIINGTVKVGIQHIQNLTIDEQVGGTAPTGTNPDGTPYAQEQVGGSAGELGALSSTLSFTIASVNAANDDLTVNVPEGFNFTTGAALNFVTTSGSAPAGDLQNGVNYTINVVTPNTSTGTTTVIQLMDPTANPTVPIVAGTISNNELQVASASGLSAGEAVVYVTQAASTITQAVSAQPAMLYNNATGGTFKVKVNGAADATAIAYNASASALASALNSITGVSGVTVTGSGTSAHPWVINGLGSATLSTDDSQLTGGSGSSTITQAITAQPAALHNNATSGSFTIAATVSSGTETTGPIPYNASATVVQNALNSLTGLAGVTVSGSGTAGAPWSISGLGGATLSTDDSLLTRAQTDYVIVVDPTHVKLANSFANATAATPVPITLTGTASGSLNPVFSASLQALLPTDSVAGTRRLV